MNTPKTVIVYKKSKSSKKHYMYVTNQHVDRVLSNRKRPPVLSNSYEIVRVGVGNSFIDKWKQEYNIRKHQGS